MGGRGTRSSGGAGAPPSASGPQSRTDTFTVHPAGGEAATLQLSVIRGDRDAGAYVHVRVDQVTAGGLVKVGHAEFGHRRNGELYPNSADVKPAFQRLGIATRMYNAAESLSGGRVIVSSNQTSAGAALNAKFRASRKP